VITGRIRHKVCVSRMKGIWMGGCPPLRYEAQDRKPVENAGDAAHVRWVFARFIEIGSGTVLARKLAEQVVTTSRGHRIDKKFIYRMLNNRVYMGDAVHKGTSYPGEHAAIIDRETWDKVHAILTESPRKRASNTRADTPALLKGLFYGPDGTAFSPTHIPKGGRL
jgi:hypothetical protein